MVGMDSCEPNTAHEAAAGNFVPEKILGFG